MNFITFYPLGYFHNDWFLPTCEIISVFYRVQWQTKEYIYILLLYKNLRYSESVIYSFMRTEDWQTP